MPLLRRLEAAGARLALPVVAGKGKPLIMRAYAFGQELNAGVWGIREPKDDAPEVDPDILIVPLAAFDRRGNRIGHGAGYYDMTIHRLRAMQADRRRRHRLCGPGGRRGSRHGARRAARSCANRARRVRFPVKAAYANSLHRRHRGPQRPAHPARPHAEADRRVEARPRRGQRRERRRRLRHHRGDLQRDDRRRRRRRHARQPRLGPARGAGVHRARAAAGSPDQLSARHAGARRGDGRGQERRARARHQRHGPHLHGPARRSVRRGRPRACRLSAEKRGRRHHRRHALRGDQREAGDGLSLRRPRQPRDRHPHPLRRPRITASCRAAPRSCRTSA